MAKQLPTNTWTGREKAADTLGHIDSTAYHLPALLEQPLRIALVHDDPKSRGSFVAVLRAKAPKWVLSTYGNVGSALEQIPVTLPSVVLIDLALPEQLGIACTAGLKAMSPRLPLIILSAHPESETVLLALRAGAQGCLFKPVEPDAILHGVAQAVSGRLALCPKARQLLPQAKWPNGSHHANFTDREKTTMVFLAIGAQDKEIADFMGISVRTVNTYTAAAFHKLEVHSRDEAVRKYFGIP